MLVPPTTDHHLVAAAVERLDFRSETAVGEAIFASLDALATVRAVRPADVPQQVVRRFP